MPFRNRKLRRILKRYWRSPAMPCRQCVPPAPRRLPVQTACIREREVDNLVSLTMPMKVHELLQTLEMMEGEIRRQKKRMKRMPAKRSEEDKKIIQDAKALLMERNAFSEEEAHRYIQERSMESGTGLVEVSQMILSVFQ